MSRSGNVPVRMCVGCGARSPQRSLVRFAIRADGELVLVGRGGHCGRTAYLHAAESCWARFSARKGPIRSLGASVGREGRKVFVEVLRAGPANRS